MGRKLLIANTDYFGDMWIPDKELLGIQLAQLIIHHVFYKHRFPEYSHGLFNKNIRSEVHDLFELHQGVMHIPPEHLEQLIDMGVGYMLSIMTTIEELQFLHNREPSLITNYPTPINRVTLVV